MDSIKKLADLFAKFPTIGPRTANRFVAYLITLPKEKTDELAESIKELKNKVKLCSFCFNYYQDDSNLCLICRNSLRDKKLLCIVEKETDLASIENTKKYNGRYFILGGNIGLRKDTENIRIKELSERIKNSLPSEIIIALNSTPEGRATSTLVEKTIKELSLSGLKITHLAQGIPIGGELEYADEETLQSAFEGRK